MEGRLKSKKFIRQIFLNLILHKKKSRAERIGHVRKSQCALLASSVFSNFEATARPEDDKLRG